MATVLERAKLLAQLQGKEPLAKANRSVRGERLRRGQQEKTASVSFEDMRYPLAQPVVGTANYSGIRSGRPEFEVLQDNVRLYCAVDSDGVKKILIGNAPDCFWVNKGSETMPGQHYAQMAKSLMRLRAEIIRRDVEHQGSLIAAKGRTAEESAAIFDGQVRREFSSSPQASKITIKSPRYDDPVWDRYRDSYMEDDQSVQLPPYPDRELEVVRYLHVNEQGEAFARNGAFRMQKLGQLFWVQFSDLNGEKTEVFKKVERDGLVVMKMSPFEARMVLDEARKKFGKEVGAEALFARLEKAADELDCDAKNIKSNIIDFDRILKQGQFKKNALDISGFGSGLTLSQNFVRAAGGTSQLPKKSDFLKSFTKTVDPQGQNNSSAAATGQPTGQAGAQSGVQSIASTGGLQGQSHDNP